jgi:hypothetical protein
MVANIFRLISLLCAALIAGVAFCHVLELPNKMTLPAATWLNVQQVLYRGFGSKAGSIEVAAVVSTLVLLFLIRKRRMSFVLTLIASVCFVAGLVIWFMVVNPVNLLVDSWTVTSLPADWTDARNQWEYGHATHAALFIVGLVALILSVLAETTAGSVWRAKQK